MQYKFNELNTDGQQGADRAGRGVYVYIYMYVLGLATGAGAHALGQQGAGRAGRGVARGATHVRATRQHARTLAAARPRREPARLARARHLAYYRGGAVAHWR